MLTVAIVCLSSAVDVAAQTQHDYLPLRPNSTWRFVDREGSETDMSVEAEENVDGLACFRVEWSADWNGWRTYQSEAWCPTETGLLVPYRETFLGRSNFDRPYVLLNRPLNPGDAWSDSVMVGGALSATVDISVGEEEQIETPAGNYRALPVSIQVNGGAIVRWYVEDLGMVRETTYLADGDELTLIEDKRLVKSAP